MALWQVWGTSDMEPVRLQCQQRTKNWFNHVPTSSWQYTTPTFFSIYPLSYQTGSIIIIIIMRLPYIPNPPEFTKEEDKAVLERIKHRRGKKGLIALDQTLLHSPPVADGWWVYLFGLYSSTNPQSIQWSLFTLEQPTLWCNSHPIQWDISDLLSGTPFSAQSERKHLSPRQFVKQRLPVSPC